MTTGDTGPSRTLGALLRGLRKRGLLTQEQLAARSGVSVGTIRGMEAGRIRRPRSASVRLLADALGLPDWERKALVAAAQGVQPQPAEHASAPPRQLPADVPDFTGRGRELERLDGWLPVLGGDSPTAVVVAVITGAAGVGKTALAVHWSHRVVDQFPDGQIYLNLRGYAPGPPLAALQALSHALHGMGVSPDMVPLDVEQAAGLYRSLLARRRVLLVLDNARDAEQVRPLLPGGPGCLAVITSRDRFTGLIASHGARRLELDLLTPVEGVALLGRVAGQDRVAAAPEAATELVRLCGYLPLALRIAAANLSSHPEESIAGYVANLREGDVLAALETDGDPEAAVPLAFDLSYHRLGPDAQRLFRLLGLVPGPDFTVHAAAALAEMPVGQTSGLLQRLAAAHLIESRGSGRFGLHDLLRLYAHQRSEDDGKPQRQQAVGRLLEWYLHTADMADRLLYPEVVRLAVPEVAAALTPVRFDSPTEALAWLVAEQANLVTAVQHAAEQGPRPLAWLLADALRGYFFEHRHMVDWLAVADAGLRAAEVEGDPRARAAAHRSLGHVRGCLGDPVRAAEHYRSALVLARQAGWVDGEAAALNGLAAMCTFLGQLQQAAGHYAQVLALYRQTDYQVGQAVVLANLGDVLRQMGRPEQAVDQLSQAVALYRKTGAQGGEAVALANLGEAFRDLGRLGDAQAHLTQALALARELGNRYGEALNLYALAAVHRDAGRLPLALELAEAGLAMAHEIGEPRVQADALNTLGSVKLHLGGYEQAAEHHRLALELAQRTSAPYPYPQAEALLGLAGACQQLGRHTQAVQHAEQALTIAGQAGLRLLEGCAHSVLAATHLDLDRGDRAVGHGRQAVGIHRESGYRLGHARALVVLGRALDRTNDTGAARASWQQALALFSDMGSPDTLEVCALLRSREARR